MCSQPDKPNIIPNVVEPPSRNFHLHSSQPAASKSGERSSRDIEMIGANSEPDAAMIDLNYYRLIDNVWHFSSVDWGAKC